MKDSSPRRRLTSVCWDSSPSGFAGFSFGLGFSIRLPVSSSFLATSSVVANFLPLAFFRSFLAKKSSKSAMLTRQSPGNTRTERGRSRTCDERVNYSALRTRPITDWSGSSLRPSTWACLHRKSVASSARVKRATKRPWQDGISRRRRSWFARKRSAEVGLATPTIFHASSSQPDARSATTSDSEIARVAHRLAEDQRERSTRELITWKLRVTLHAWRTIEHASRRARDFPSGKWRRIDSSGARVLVDRAKSHAKGRAARGVERRG